MAVPVTAISIDGGFLQILQAKKKGKGMAIECAVLEPFSKEMESKEKSDLIQEMWRSYSLKGRDVTLVVPRSLWTVKMVTVPSSVKETVKQVMDINIEQYLPFSMAESLWDWEILRQGPGEESVVLLMAMRKQDFDERLEILKGANLNLTGVEVSNVGLLNTAQFLYPNMAQQRVAFVDLQHGWVDVMVVDRGEMTTSRGIDLVKGIEAIPTWVGEVRHTLIAYDQNHPLGKIEKVVMVASRKMLNLLRDRKFEEPIQRPYQALEVTFDGDPVPDHVNTASLAGPLLRQLGVANEAFFLPRIMGRAVEPRKGLGAVPTWVWVTAGAALLTAVVAAGFHIKVNQTLNELKAHQAQLKRLQAKPVVAMDAWEYFLTLMGARTKGIWFDNFDCSVKKITVQGKALTIEATYEFLHHVKSQKGFERAKLDPPREQKGSSGQMFWIFSMNIDVGPAPAKK